MRVIKPELYLAAISISLGACAPLTSGMQSQVSSSKAQAPTPKVAADYSCLDTKVDYILNTDVVDFEMQDGGGLTAGFSPSGLGIVGISVGVSYSDGELQTMMHILDPLKPGVPIVNVPGQASDSNFSFSLDVNFSIASFGPSFWFTTPIATLSNNALTNNLQGVSDQLNALQTDWWTTVTELNGNTGFFIPVGASAGIQVGDEFKVMDVTYEWAGDGTPCGANELIMPLVNSTTPKVIAKAQTVTVDYAYLVIESSTKPIGLHDYVTISALTQSTPVTCTNFLGIGCPAQGPTTRNTLARSVRIGTITSKPLPFVGQNNTVQNVDISPFVSEQLQTLLSQQSFAGFYVHQ
jgi:hypothetical protein